tara:strand:- start:7 stop:432 length:426 start_codon:yes stop_codon:yes gene_type:complete
MVQLNPAKWGKKKKEEETPKPRRTGRLPLKERKAAQAAAMKKREEEAAKRAEARANRPWSELSHREKAGRKRSQTLKAQKELKEQKKAAKNNKSSTNKTNKSKLKMSSIERENRARFGDKEIDALKARHKAWKEARRKKKK